MRRLRKAAAVFTAAVMTMAMGMSAYAGTISDIGGSDSKAVTGTYVAGGSAATVYKVDITWGSMEFTYTAAGEGTWDPETHTYTGTTSGSWSSAEGAGDIKVTNHSNAAVNAALEFKAGDSFTAVTGSFTANKLPLADTSAESVGKPEAAPAASATLSLSGDPGNFADSTALGTVTVTISAGN